MRFRNLLSKMLLVCGVVVLLAACAAPTPTPPPAAAAATQVVQVAATIEGAQQAFSLLGSEWQLESLLGTPVAAGTMPTLGFGADRYMGFGGCDYFMGVWVARGSELSLQAPAKTAGGCINEPQATEQQGSYLVALTNVITYAQEGEKLVLFTTDKQRLMTLVPLQAVPLRGTTWDLSFYYDATNAVWLPVAPGARITAQFDGEQISGNAGCNDYSAKYTLTDNRLKIEAIAVTNETCALPDGVMEQEQGYLKLLQTAGLMQQFPRSVQFLTSDAQPLLMYHAQSAK